MKTASYTGEDDETVDQIQCPYCGKFFPSEEYHPEYGCPICRGMGSRSKNA